MESKSKSEASPSREIRYMAVNKYSGQKIFLYEESWPIPLIDCEQWTLQPIKDSTARILYLDKT